VDKGFLNTAVINSTITYIDGDAGGELSFYIPLDRVCGIDFVGKSYVIGKIAYNLGSWLGSVLTFCRGYPIEQLAVHSNFLETAYLLIYGSLPTRDQHRIFEGEVMHHSVAHVDAEELFRSFRYEVTNYITELLAECFLKL